MKFESGLNICFVRRLRRVERAKRYPRSIDLYFRDPSLLAFMPVNTLESTGIINVFLSIEHILRRSGEAQIADLAAALE